MWVLITLWHKMTPRSLYRPNDQMIFSRLFAVGAALVSSYSFAARSPGPVGDDPPRERYAQIWYVASDSPTEPRRNGSRTAPWTTIHEAVRAAEGATADQPHAVFVAAGAYSGQTLHLRENVDLYGGFCPLTWKRNLRRHATVLDGEGRRRIVIACDDAVVDGFVFRRGVARGEGGALLCAGTSPTITNNYFVSNMTRAPEPWAPTHLHENAHDGGAIAVLDGAAPLIQGNLFFKNCTEVGRGGAVALDRHAAGVIADNVFLQNVAGTIDEHRSSDGGAVSVFDWSAPEIRGNLFLENRALARNDGGAIFVCLWSAPQMVANVFAGNACDDDGGAIFIGGQEHRYERPPDPRPLEENYLVVVSRNRFAGNSSPRNNSGGMRVVKEARVRLVNNLFHSSDQVYMQASDVHLVNNTIIDAVIFREMAGDQWNGVVANNIFRGDLDGEPPTTATCCYAQQPLDGEGNFSTAPKLASDGAKLVAGTQRFDAAQAVTAIEIEPDDVPDASLVGRIVRAGDRWSVIQDQHDNSVVVWGDFSDAQELEVVPSYRLNADSPCIDRGCPRHAPDVDLHEDRRPTGQGVDVGADEYAADPPPRDARP